MTESRALQEHPGVRGREGAELMALATDTRMAHAAAASHAREHSAPDGAHRLAGVVGHRSRTRWWQKRRAWCVCRLGSRTDETPLCARMRTGETNHIERSHASGRGINREGAARGSYQLAAFSWIRHWFLQRHLLSIHLGQGQRHTHTASRGCALAFAARTLSVL